VLRTPLLTTAVAPGQAYYGGVTQRRKTMDKKSALMITNKLVTVLLERLIPHPPVGFVLIVANDDGDPKVHMTMSTDMEMHRALKLCGLAANEDNIESVEMPPGTMKA
jgi:hypothetical protein